MRNIKENSSSGEKKFSEPIWIDPNKVVRFLGIGASTFLLLHIAQRCAYHFNIPISHELLGRFDINKERTFPTFFQGILLMIPCFLLALTAALEKKSATRAVGGWTFLSALFLFLASDEIVCIHERIRDWIVDGAQLINHTNPWMKSMGETFFPTWVILYLPMALLVFILLYKWFSKLPAATRFYFLLAGAFYVLGAAGSEIFQYFYLKSENDFSTFGYEVYSVTEEGLEMAGVIIFIWALLDYMANRFKNISFKIERAYASKAPQARNYHE
jgi:hypothetical protein